MFSLVPEKQGNTDSGFPSTRHPGQCDITVPYLFFSTMNQGVYADECGSRWFMPHYFLFHHAKPSPMLCPQLGPREQAPLCESARVSPLYMGSPHLFSVPLPKLKTTVLLAHTKLSLPLWPCQSLSVFQDLSSTPLLWKVIADHSSLKQPFLFQLLHLSQIVLWLSEEQTLL